MLQSARHGSPRLGSRLRWAGAATAGVIVGLGVFALRDAGWLYGWQALVLAAALVIAIPSAKSLSGRIAANGVTVIGLSVFGWAFVSDINRATVVLAVAAGALVAWTGLRVNRARRLLPEVRWVDAWPLAGALATAYMAAPWFRVASSVGALSMMQGGWDNNAHFNIFETIRQIGCTSDIAGLSPDGTRWGFAEYPAGFHTLAAGLADLIWGHRVSTLNDLVIFAHIIGITLVLATLILLATICASPTIRLHPLRAGIGATWITAVLLFSQFGTLADNGFTNLILAACLAASVVVMAANVQRIHTPGLLLPIAAGLIGVAHGWILLVTYAGLAVALLLLPMKRDRYRGTRREWVVFGAIVALLVGGIAHAVSVIWSLTATGVLDLPGGTPIPPMGVVLALSAFVVAASLWSISRHRRSVGSDPTTTRLILTLGSSVGFAILGAAGLAAMQIASSGAVTYYFWKFVFALFLQAAVTVAIAWVAIPGTIPAVSRSTRIAVMTLMCLGTTQIFGLAVPFLPYAGISPEAPGWNARAGLSNSINHPSTSAALSIDLLNSVEIHDDEYPYFVLPDGDKSVDPILAAQWFLGLSGHYSTGAGDGFMEYPAYERTPANLEKFLKANPKRVLVVDEATARQLSESIHDPSLLSRIRTS